MIILNSQSDNLTLITTSTAELDCHTSFVDYLGGTATPGRKITQVVAVATSTIVVAPGLNTARNVKSILISNNDASLPQGLQVLNTDGTATASLWHASLGAGEHVEYHDSSGWSQFDSAGAKKTNQTPSAGAWVKRTTVTAAGTGTLTTGSTTTKACVRMVAGGGQGGGVSTAATAGAGGGGGAAGGYAEKMFTVTPNTGYVYIIGAGGSTSTGGLTGQIGGNTSFAVGATTVTAVGGPGGIGTAATAGTAVTLGGAPSAISTNGDINSAGEAGWPGMHWGQTPSVSGKGGSGPFGAGGNSNTAQSTGAAGTGNGSGGAGGNVVSGGAVAPGGAGTAGAIVVDEYS
jgi:hypothetical protein